MSRRSTEGQCAKNGPANQRFFKHSLVPVCRSKLNRYWSSNQSLKYRREWGISRHCELKKELFTYADNRIAVHFEYEYRDDNGQWFRAYGNEHWEFDEQGLMQTRDASINECTIDEGDRRL
ncbi:MAG: DUF1348 family protein [Algicola sp.]|nr:DUF1348 family protein [Algicola sp.]